MKKRTGFSLLMTILTILSTFTIVDAIKINDEKCELCANVIERDLCPIHPIYVMKKVWDPYIGGWVDYYDAELSEIVLFNITITYHKNCLFGKSAKDIQVIDDLPSGLNYEGSLSYNESFIDGNLIYWNLSDDYGIILYDDESIFIEFEAYVNEYGEHENYVEVFAFEQGCSWNLYGDSDATVNGVPPDPSFEKKVKDSETGEWVEETFQYVTEIVTFKIELIYYGIYNLTDVKIVDHLPEVTYYANEANIDPTYISGDGKIVWWNLTVPVEDDEPLNITFDAYVFGSTGDCPYCGINLVEYNAVENVTQKPHQGNDTAEIVTDYYDDPELAYSPNNINFGEHNQGWTGSDTFEIWNSGQQTLTYTISENLDWIEVTPTGGTSEGEHDTITVSVVNTIDMSGYYGGNIDISSNGGNGSIFVTIYIQKEEPNDPELAYSPNNINFGEHNQGWTGSDTFEIWNSGQQTLTYTISENLDWIEVTPTDGTSEGEHDTITVSVVDTTGMSGFYGGNIDISSNGGNGSIFVALYIQEEEPELKVSIKRGIGRSIKVYIENTGDVDVNDITWNLTVTRRGIIKRTLLDVNDTISTLGGGLKETVGDSPFGFGLITVNVNVTAPGIEPIEKTAKGFIFLRFVRLRRFFIKQ